MYVDIVCWIQIWDPLMGHDHTLSSLCLISQSVPISDTDYRMFRGIVPVVFYLHKD